MLIEDYKFHVKIGANPLILTMSTMPTPGSMLRKAARGVGVGILRSVGGFMPARVYVSDTGEDGGSKYRV